MKKTASWMLVIGVAAVTVYAEPAALFKKWDKDKNGVISKAEFFEMTKAQMEAKGQTTGYEAEAAKRFKKRDLNKDGVLSPEEFAITPAPQKPIILE